MLVCQERHFIFHIPRRISDADFFAAAFQVENVLSVLELDINLYIARLPQGLICIPFLTLIPNE